LEFQLELSVEGWQWQPSGFNTVISQSQCVSVCHSVS
jgi:hypothetical protein